MGEVHRLSAVSLVVSSEQKKPRRSRKALLARALREAAMAGASVIGAIFEPGKVTLQFGEPKPTASDNPWDTAAAELRGKGLQ